MEILCTRKIDIEVIFFLNWKWMYLFFCQTLSMGNWVVLGLDICSHDFLQYEHLWITSGEWCHQGGGVRYPSFYSPPKNEQVDCCPWTEIILGELRCPLEKSQQHRGIKNLRLTTQKEKEQLHLPASSHPPSSTAKRKIPCLKRVFLAGIGRVGWATCFHSLFGHCIKDSLWFHHIQILPKLRHLKKTKDQEIVQRLSISTP